MTLRSNNSRNSRAVARIAVGAGALTLLGVLSAVHGGGIHPGPGPRVEAGSGSAATNTVYNQPVVGSIHLGDTATATTAANAPQVTKAAPGVLAH
jgi:hypothetical protein